MKKVLLFLFVMSSCVYTQDNLDACEQHCIEKYLQPQKPAPQQPVTTPSTHN